MDLAELEAERVEEVLQRHGALAITLTDAGDDPVLEPVRGETPLWRHTQVTALFDIERDLTALKADLEETLAPQPLPKVHVETVADRAWEREWLKDFKPLRFGERLWVCPHGMRVPTDDALIVHLDPGLAFGTGTHPTTALCLRWLDTVVSAGDRVFDFGCGSGILAIAALKLGADSATAIDIDPQALTATRDNAQRNGVSARLHTTAEDTAVFDLVVANVLAQPLVEHAQEIAARLQRGGRIALCGILAEQAPNVSAAFEPWIDFASPETQDGWHLLHGVRR